MRLIYVSNLDVYFEWTLVPCESSGHCLPQLPWPDQAKKAISSPSTRLELSVKRHPYFHDRQTLQGNLSTAGFQNASKKSTQANLLRRRPFKDRSIPSFGTKIEGQIACVYIYNIYMDAWIGLFSWLLWWVRNYQDATFFFWFHHQQAPPSVFISGCCISVQVVLSTVLEISLSLSLNPNILLVHSCLPQVIICIPKRRKLSGFGPLSPGHILLSLGQRNTHCLITCLVHWIV